MTRAIVLFGHGSRDPQWRAPMDAVASRIASRSATRVECAFLELQAPDLAAAVSALARESVQEITVIPMFLGIGRHAREDLPALVATAQAEHPCLRIRTTPAVGEWDSLLDALAEQAIQRS